MELYIQSAQLFYHSKSVLKIKSISYVSTEEWAIKHKNTMSTYKRIRGVKWAQVDQSQERENKEKQKKYGKQKMHNKVV